MISSDLVNHAPVTSTLDYCISLYVKMALESSTGPKSHNLLARAGLLSILHWCFGNQFEMLVLNFDVLSGRNHRTIPYNEKAEKSWLLFLWLQWLNEWQQQDFPSGHFKGWGVFPSWRSLWHKLPMTNLCVSHHYNSSSGNQSTWRKWLPWRGEAMVLYCAEDYLPKTCPPQAVPPKSSIISTTRNDNLTLTLPLLARFAIPRLGNSRRFWGWNWGGFGDRRDFSRV